MFARSKGAAILAAATLALGIGVWAVTSRPAKTVYDRRPGQNLLLIAIDTLRADAMSSYGGPAPTPNLDALAARGTRFDFAHAHATLTRPPHASILTGTYPYENGVRDHSGYRLKAGMPTIASMLKAKGFETGAFVGGVPLETQRGNLPGAGQALEQAVGLDSRSARAHNGLGVVAMRTDAADEAFTHWQRAVELAPNDFDALFNLGMELDAAGRHDEARPFLDRFMREAPRAQYSPDIVKVKRLLER